MRATPCRPKGYGPPHFHHGLLEVFGQLRVAPLVVALSLTAGWQSAGSQVGTHTQPDAAAHLETISFGSCWHDEEGTTRAAMERLAAQSPDLFLWLGDNIYGDTEDMTEMRAIYDAKKNGETYQPFLQARIPVMATWDDHDFGENNAGNDYAMRVESQREFLRHFDIPTDDVRHRDVGDGGQAGVYNATLFGSAAQNDRVNVIMLDARYHRSPTFIEYGACEGAASTMLGEEQWSWLEQQLTVISEITVIASGTQVLPPLNRARPLTDYCAYGDGTAFNTAIANLGETYDSGTEYESWAEIPAQRERLLRLTQKAVQEGNTKLVIFVSGDQHWGELLQKTMPPSATGGAAVTLYEVTGSGFDQDYPENIPNPNRLPIWADTRGNGTYDARCQLPFGHAGTTYGGCTTADRTAPWCYTQLDAHGNGVPGAWGECAPAGATIPTGQVGSMSDNLLALTTQDRHIINKPLSKYGSIAIDWVNSSVTLRLETEAEVAVSTIVSFQP